MIRLVQWFCITAPTVALIIYKLLPLFHFGAHLVGAPHPH